MNKTDKKVREYLRRAEKIVGDFDGSNYQKYEIYLHQLKVIEVAGMIQREELNRNLYAEALGKIHKDFIKNL